MSDVADLDPLGGLERGDQMPLCGAMFPFGQSAAVCTREPHPDLWRHLAVDQAGTIVHAWRSS